MYWKLILTWLSRFKNLFKTGIITDFMESSHRQKDLVKNAKIVRVVKKVDFSLKPLRLTISKVYIYDDFEKISIKNKQIEIKLDK
jgi:hypothetical protein